MIDFPEWMTEEPYRPARESAVADGVATAFALLDRAADHRVPGPFDPADRRTFIGGSDVAAILGLSPWRTPVDVYFDKVAGEPEVSDPRRLVVLRRGKALEPYVLRMLQDEHQGLEVAGTNKRYQDQAVPFFAAEVDFEWRGAFENLATEGDEVANGEIKTVHPFAGREWGEAGSEEVPIHYAAQALWGLGVTGRRFTVVAALFGADNLVAYRVLRDEDTLFEMRRRAREFWERHVLRLDPPPPQTLADVGRLWPRDRGTYVEASPEVAAHVASFFAIREKVRSFEAAKDALELLIAEHMKDASILTYGGRELCRRPVMKRTSIKLDEIRERAPELAEELETSKEYRVIFKPRERKR